jgi:hypothetical protein
MIKEKVLQFLVALKNSEMLTINKYALRKIKLYINVREVTILKGTLTRDFRPLVFFIKQLPLGH